jgi:predicted Zn-dependent peptidase
MKKIMFSIALLGALSTGTFAQLDRSIRPKPGPAPELQMGTAQSFVSSNGIKVYVVENHKLPVVSYSMDFDIRPELQGDMTGFKDFMGDLLTAGTKTKTKDQFNQELDMLGARLQISSDGIYMQTLKKNTDKLLALGAEVLTQPRFSQEELDKLKKQAQSGLAQMQDDPESMSRNITSILNYGKNHPYGEVMTEATLNAIKREDVMNFYKANFTPNGSYLVVVGDITRAETEAMVNKYFGSWSGGPIYTNPTNDGSFTKGNRVIFVKKPGAVQSVVYVTFPVKMRTGDKNQLALNVLNGILGGGGFGTRLMQNLREDKAYTYGCYSSMNITEDGSWMSAGGNFRNAVTDSAITQILKEFEKITNELVTDEELNLTKSAMAGNFARSLERPSTIARFALNIKKYGLPSDYYQTYLQKLEAITKEDILNMAQQYFTSKNCNIIVVGNEEIINNLKKFDADGKIELLDAFGNEMKEVKKADIPKEQVIERYVYAVTQTKNKKELAKKLKKVKSYERVLDMTSAAIPIPLKMTDYWVATVTEAQKMEGQGMVFQKSYYDGKTGFTYNMQTGKKELTAEELESKRKSS